MLDDHFVWMFIVLVLGVLLVTFPTPLFAALLMRLMWRFGSMSYQATRRAEHRDRGETSEENGSAHAEK